MLASSRQPSTTWVAECCAARPLTIANAALPKFSACDTWATMSSAATRPRPGSSAREPACAALVVGTSGPASGSPGAVISPALAAGSSPGMSATSIARSISSLRCWRSRSGMLSSAKAPWRLASRTTQRQTSSPEGRRAGLIAKPWLLALATSGGSSSAQPSAAGGSRSTRLLWPSNSQPGNTVRASAAWSTSCSMIDTASPRQSV